MTDKQTHFGYQSVSEDEKAGKVANVFHSVAKNYDIMNDLMSLGTHRLWKRFTMNVAKPHKGDKVLDLAGGTGDLTKLFAKRIGDSGNIFISDIFFFLDKTILVNYADDNTTYGVEKDIMTLLKSLESDTYTVLNWLK